LPYRSVFDELPPPTECEKGARILFWAKPAIRKIKVGTSFDGNRVVHAVNRVKVVL